jgi:hypothetical protein
MEEAEAEQIPLLTLPQPQEPPQPLLPSPPPSPPSESTQPVPPLSSLCHTECDPLLTPLPESFTEEEQDEFLRHLLRHIQESSQGASAEEFCDDQLRMLDYININASSSDSGTSYRYPINPNEDGIALKMRTIHQIAQML